MVVQQFSSGTSLSETDPFSSRWSRSPWEQHLGTRLKNFVLNIKSLTYETFWKDGTNDKGIHFCDEHQGAFGAEKVQQTGHPGVSEAGKQVPFLKGPGPCAAPQRQELGGKHFPCPSVDHTLHYPKGSPGTVNKLDLNARTVDVALCQMECRLTFRSPRAHRTLRRVFFSSRAPLLSPDTLMVLHFK